MQTEKAKFSHFDRTRGDKNQIFRTKEENDETLLNLGEAIRSGNEENVLKIIGANSIRIESLVSKIGLMFETYLRKKDIAKDSENICSDSKKKKLDEMFVSPFQLAILAQQAKVVLVMLEGLLKYTKTPIETFAKLLAMKTEVSFARGSPFSYVFEDMNLDGVKSFHLAARFHAQSLLTIVKFLRNNDILEHVSPLLLGRVLLQLHLLKHQSLRQMLVR